MRKRFSELLHAEMATNKDIFLLTGDLGYRLWDSIRDDYPENFLNVGSAEQLMIGTAVGMALEKKIPITYSITPFLLYRPFEFIRNYLHYEKTPVKLVGGGRGLDYGKMGHTHLACEDKEIMSILSNIKQYYPETKEELEKCFFDFLYNAEPCYLNLKK